MHPIELRENMRTTLENVEFIPINASYEPATPLVTRSSFALAQSMREVTHYRNWLREQAI